MNSVERVKLICKERNIAISRLEKDLGYANGYIGQLRKGVFPDDRLVEIAKYLGVPTDYLLTGEQKEMPALPEEDELKLKVAAYWGGGEDLSQEELDELWKDAGSYFRFKMREKRRGNRSSGT